MLQVRDTRACSMQQVGMDEAATVAAELHKHRLASLTYVPEQG